MQMDNNQTVSAHLKLKPVFPGKVKKQKCKDVTSKTCRGCGGTVLFGLSLMLPF